FFPEIDESMDQIFVRFTPGISLADAAKALDTMGKTLSHELPVEMVVANIGTPQNARSAIVSPNAGPHTGFLRLALTPAEHRQRSQGEIAVRAREILTEKFPGVETLQAPGGLVASVFSNGFSAPIVLEVGGDRLEELASQAKAIAAVARSVPGVRDVEST